MNNQEKGLLYEKYVKNFIIQQLGKNAYLWNECPENILIANNLIHSHNDMRLLRKDMKEGYLHNHKDIGIDIIQIDNDKCSIVQCKNGYNNGLCVDDISGIMMRCAFIRDVNTFIYYTNCLSRNIRYTANISPYVVNIDCSTKIDKLLEVYENKIYFVKLPYENKINTIEDIRVEIVPYSYQTEAVATFKEHYQTNNRGILSLPCGCGKTYTSYLISKDYKHIVILSPLREFASQNLNRFVEYGYDKNNTLLVDTDGNRDIDTIKEFIENSNNILISCTYNSMDLISKCLDLFKDALFIIDEFHNLSKANISDDDNNICKLLMSDHKIMFMSATPRIYDIEYDDNENYDIENLFGNVVYQMTFTDAISNKYITDYKIWLPSIHENNEELDKELSIYEIDNQIKNRCKFLYSCIANNGSRKCIVYCKDIEDMKAMMECMETLNDFYIMDVEMQSISCEDSEKRRRSVLENFANNNDKIQLLFNIRILNECIDIPACDSIYISYAPKNKITTIQRISRATRTDKNNPYKIANVYIWCEAYEEILETLSSIKEYDIMFKDKIKVNAVDFYHSKEDKEIELVENDKKLLSNCVVGIKEFKMYSWEEKLQMVEDYINENGRLPLSTDRNVKSLRFWINDNLKAFKNNTRCMKSDNIRRIWKDFMERNAILFRTNEEIWRDTLQKVEIYITKYMSLPSQANKDKNIKKLASFINTCKINYNQQHYIMKNEIIRKEWELFIKKYHLLFLNDEERWKYNLEKAYEYIKINNKRPSSSDKNCEIKRMASWINTQQQNYKNKLQILEKEEFRQLWENFINENKILFRSDEEIWEDNLILLVEYIKENGKLPPYDSTSLGPWITRQKRIYKEVKEIMENQIIRKKWEEFIDNYSHLFKTNEDIWKYNLKMLYDYVEQYDKLPSCENKNKEIKSLGKWVGEQKLNCKGRENRQGLINKNKEIGLLWQQFMDKYSYLFKTNEELWKDTLELAEKYIIENEKTPSLSDKNNETKKLAKWLYHQNENYKTNTDIIQKDELKALWEQFINKHKFKMFMTNEEWWYSRLNQLKEFIRKHNKLPTCNEKNQDDKDIGIWLGVQKRNYKNNKEIMKEEKIRIEWKEFINENSELFMTNEEMWLSKFNKLCEFIEKNNKLPSRNNKDKTLQTLPRWIQTQNENYEKNTYIMKQNTDIKLRWGKFISKYPHLF